MNNPVNIRYSKKIILGVLFLSMGVSNALGQKDRTKEIQVVLDACVQLRDAAETRDSLALTDCAVILRSENISTFSSLICLDEDEGNLDGHLVFDQDFADSLAQDSVVLSQANHFNQTRAVRGENKDGSVKIKTCFIAAKKSIKYRFSSGGGHQELAVVAEAGGKVSMKIHVTNSDGLNMNHNDRKDVRSGRPERTASFDLPKGKRNIVELEVINCVDKDISVVIISN